MKSIIISLALILTLFLFFSCSTTKKISAIKPEPDDALPIVYEAKTSFINLPTHIKIQDIENQTNKYLTGLIYEDNNIEDDNIAIKVWKTAPIKLIYISEGKGKIKTILPLKITINYRYGIEKFGIKLYDTKEFNLNGSVVLESNVNISNWHLKTNTSFKSIDWNESPTISIAGKEIAITYLINPALKIFKSKIEKSIDENIEKSLDFKPEVLNVLETMSVPFLMSDAYETWLRVVPIELYVTNASLNKESISMEMGLKCTIETFIGKIPEKIFDKNKIVLKPVAKMPNKVTANIVSVSTYRDASKVVTKNFYGQEFGDGKRKVTVQKVEMWHKKGKIIIALDLLGSINGTIYLSGLPKYNSETFEIYFEDLEYVLDTKNALLKTANWLAKGIILKKIQESCIYSIKPNLDEGKQNILNYMTNYSPIKGVYVNGNIDEFKFESIKLTNKAILAIISTSGQVNVTINGLE